MGIAQLAGSPVKVLQNHLRLRERDPAINGRLVRLIKDDRVVEDIVDLHDAVGRVCESVSRDIGPEVSRPQNVDRTRSILKRPVGGTVSFVARPVIV